MLTLGTFNVIYKLVLLYLFCHIGISVYYIIFDVTFFITYGKGVLKCYLAIAFKDTLKGYSYFSNK